MAPDLALHKFVDMDLSLKKATAIPYAPTPPIRESSRGFMLSFRLSIVLVGTALIFRLLSESSLRKTLTNNGYTLVNYITLAIYICRLMSPVVDFSKCVTSELPHQVNGSHRGS
ncbi:hypothetical protein F5B21DRAFT_483749 [Xylaria acuta]|nr:hypothetical protein F5B21DRAFT_483749 [Xylaria acuta]